VTHQNCPDWKAGNPKYVPVLERRLRFVGDAVALVAADSEEIAEEALGLIEVEYRVLPRYLTSTNRWRKMHPGFILSSPATSRPADSSPSVRIRFRRLSAVT